jgi:hypothetical protein
MTTMMKIIVINCARPAGIGDVKGIEERHILTFLSRRAELTIKVLNELKVAYRKDYADRQDVNSM